MNQITPTGTKIAHPSETSNRVTLSPQKPTPSPLILDTLAQLTPYSGSRLLKRARSKYLTSSIAIGLADMKTPLEKYYWNAWHCNCTLLQQGDTVTGKYCNTRICYTCNRIRTAKMIHGYVPAICSMLEPRFVTLTRLSVTGDALSGTLTDMCTTFRRTLKLNCKRKRYGNSTIQNGIRKTEVTYNAKCDTYHPHFHIICDGQLAAEQLVASWMALNPGVTDIKAQNIRPVDELSLMELFKYSTKIVTAGKRSVPLPALDIIMRSLYGRRMIQPYGAIRRVSEEVDELRSDSYPELPEYELMEWTWHEHDWINRYAECLTGFIPESEN